MFRFNRYQNKALHFIQGYVYANIYKKNSKMLVKKEIFIFS
jgi:glutamine cyclotransferase